MTISYPLSLPSGIRTPRSVRIGARSMVAMSESPFTGSQQVYAHAGEVWSMDCQLPPMTRAQAALWIGVLVALNGQEGTLLMGVPGYTTPQGTWSGTSPLVKGASQTGKTLAIDGIGAGKTVLAGDYFSLGSGSSTHLHMVTQAATANGSGEVTLDIWPRLRSAPGDNDALTIASPKGQWRLADNTRSWSIDLAAIFGLSFNLIESLTD
jgi:hypothetical protein